MCIRDRKEGVFLVKFPKIKNKSKAKKSSDSINNKSIDDVPVSYTHLRAHETVLDLVCRLLLEKKKQNNTKSYIMYNTISMKQHIQANIPLQHNNHSITPKHNQ